MSDQLPLFEDPLPEPDPRLAQLAARVPDHVRFGTSSWTFEGWKGLVYRARYATKRAFVRESLREYARFPLFRTACVDRTYYGPLHAEDWRALADQVPDDFRFCTKVWSAITSRVVDDRPNPRFFDAALFEDVVLGPAREGLGDKLGPFVVQLAPAPMRTPPGAFAASVARFLEGLPRGPRYAFELREPHLLGAAYLDALRTHPGASHLLNLHTRMPTVGAQLDRDPLRGDTAVVRLMIPPGERYAERKAAYEPFDRLVKPNPPMRRDVARVAAETARRGQALWVIANNKAEGSSPRTVIELAKVISALA